jgi:hypothetical protein
MAHLDSPWPLCPKGHRLIAETIDSTIYCPTCNSIYEAWPDGTMTAVSWKSRGAR